jgi:hypothetical protein
MTILGISANSRVVGMAVLRKGTLHDYSVKLFKERWSEEKVQKMIGCITAYAAHHRITSIALTLPHEHHKNQETATLIAQITRTCRAKKIRLSTYYPQAFAGLCQETKAKKKALMRGLAEVYPELVPLYRKELRNRRRYYHKLFEAVAAATLLYQEQIEH